MQDYKFTVTMQDGTVRNDLVAAESKDEAVAILQALVDNPDHQFASFKSGHSA